MLRKTYTAKEVAEILGVETRWFREHFSELKGCPQPFFWRGKLRKQPFFLKEEIDAWIARLARDPDDGGLANERKRLLDQKYGGVGR